MGEDCDDEQPLAWAYAEEACHDGVDNDCDILTTDDCPPLCLDNDGDGRGQGCSMGEDCDDEQPLAWAYAGETYLDGVDNDCDPSTADDTAPGVPSFDMPTSTSVHAATSFDVTVGVDPDGSQVRVRCTSVGSNYPGDPGATYDSDLGEGGRTVRPSFTWSSSGLKEVYCWSSDATSLGSAAASDMLTVFPAVSRVSPTTVTLDRVTTFTVTGVDLPSTLAFWIGECDGMVNTLRGSTEQWFQCTPRWTTGPKAYVVKDQSGGTLLDEGTITVNPGPRPPSAPSLNAPSSATINHSTTFNVTVGVDPDGNQVKVQCTSPDSNYPGTPGIPYDSGLGEGGRVVTASFAWSSTGLKAIYCTSFDPLDASSVVSDTITVLADVSRVSPTTATLNQLTTFTVTGSGLPSSLAFWIGECDGMVNTQRGSTEQRFQCTPRWTTGPKAYAVKDQSGGTLLDEGTITVNPGPRPPSAPSYNAPSSTTVNTTTTFNVTVGVDPDGSQVKVQCTSPGSNYPGTPGVTYDSGLGSGGRVVSPSFTWSSTGSKTIYCTSFDSTGAASSVVSDNITVNAASPTVSRVSPTTVTLNQLTTFIVTGTDMPGTLAFWIAECDGVTNTLRGSMEQRFQCTPRWTTGTKAYDVKDRSGGTSLKSGTITVR